MIRKLMALLMTAALLAAAVPALAADSGSDPLNLDEMRAWSDELLALADASELLNDPAEEPVTEDGYAFLYDFGTLYFSAPTRGEGSELMGAVVYDENVPGPRGVNTLYTLTQLLGSFYSENEALDGSRTEALIYLGGEIPGGAWWATLQRDGQWVDTVQYAVHELMEEGQYTDTGLVFTLQQNTVVAIRAYGLDALISGEEVLDLMEEAEAVGLETGYAMVPVSDNGADLTVFGPEDLFFAGIDFLSCTPGEALEALGEPVFDDRIEDEGASLRVLGFDDCELVFRTADGGAEELLSFTITGGDLEGPRALRISDGIAQAMRRFRFGEGAVDGGTEILYGTPGEGDWGTAEYGDDASATVRYAFALADGRQAVLMVTFEMLELTEITVYIA